MKDLFSKVGQVVSADIVTQNGRHRGMATVEFSNKEDVRRAIQDFDHSNFMEREIFVRQDNPPPPQRDSGRYGGREDRYGSRGGDRYGRDDRYGGRGDDRYGRDDRYGGRGGDRYGGRGDDRYGGRGGDRYGGRGDSYGGRDDRYGGDRGDRGDRYPPRRDNGPLYEVFVGNLPFSINWQALKDIFREAGNVVRADVRLDDNGRSRGFGVVHFSNPEDVQNAIEKFQGFQVEGRSIDVREGKNNTVGGGANASGSHGDRAEAAPVSKNSEFTEGVEGNGEKNDTIYVSNLPFATSNDDLFELFETVGRVSAAEITYDRTGRPSGHAVVKFDSEDSAEDAVLKLDNYNYGDRPLNITYAKRPQPAATAD